MVISQKERSSYQIDFERFSFLRKAPLFASLNDEELLQVCRRLESKRVPRGGVICREGEPGDAFYIIRSGAVVVFTTREGKEKRLNELYRGDVFGEMALLTGEPRSATVRALVDVDLLLLSKPSFEEIIRQYPLVNIFLSRVLSHRLIKAKSPMPDTLLPFSYSVMGSEKGVGTTSFAREVASILSSEVNKRVLVIDLEGTGTKGDLDLVPLSMPDSQLLEGIYPSYRELFVQCCCQHSSGYVLFSFPSSGSKRAVSHFAGRLSFFLGILKEKFDYILFDLPPLLDALSRRALRLSDRVLYLVADTAGGIEAARKRLIEIKKIVGDSPSTVQVGMSHLHDASRLARPSIKDALQIHEMPEIWVEPERATPARDGADVTRRMSGARRVAREIGGIRIGLALGAGGARGWAHLGVLEALEKEGIPIDMIAGSSIGALVGGTYAKTGSFQETCRLTIDKFPNKRSTKKRIYDYTVPLRGFVKGKKIWEMLQTGLEEADFLDLRIPFAAVAVDIANGEEVILDSNSVADAVRASIAMPGVFEPVRLNDRWLVDGAVVNSVPASVLIRKGMNYVIGVFLVSRQSKAEWNPIRGPHIINVLTRSYDIVRSQTSEGLSELVSVAIYPPVDDFRWDDFHRGKELVEIGREATYAVMDRIRALLP
ncbi:MAG: cyclic nucleotide-binding domain-containing protein [candidate division NC10 bacterium]|nr:cyclic nucleotide-binding domain-containing protein [candidate division NC10 bacterium]